MTRIQQSYSINPDKGFLGGLAWPNEAHTVIRGKFEHVSSGSTRKVRPGDGVLWSSTADAWIHPNSDAEQLGVQGIVTYRSDRVMNASSVLEFDSGSEIEVALMGTFWLMANGAIEPFQLVRYLRASFDWTTGGTIDAFGEVPGLIVQAIGDATIADNSMFLGRIIGPKGSQA